MNEENNKILDVVVTSSGRDTIFPTIESFLANVQYSGEFRFIVNVDLCQTKHLSDIRALFKNLNVKCFNVNHKPRGFTKSVAFVLSRIETPLYFHLEDDWIFLKRLNIDPLLSLFKKFYSLNHICFSKKKILYYNELFYLRKFKFIPVDYDKFKTENVILDDISLVKTITYSTNPNISRTNHFKKLWHVDFLNIEQQFALQNFLLGNRRGYYILGQIGDGSTVQHIG